MVAPTSDLAPLDSLPASSRGLALQSADHLQDMLRWTLGRFGRLQDVCGEVTNFMSQVAESEGNTKIKFTELSEKLVDLSNGLVGLASSVRHTQDEQLKASRQATKSLGDIGWQLSGVNTSVKESLLSLGKLLSQIDSNVGRQSKAQDPDEIPCRCGAAQDDSCGTSCQGSFVGSGQYWTSDCSARIGAGNGTCIGTSSYGTRHDGSCDLGDWSGPDTFDAGCGTKADAYFFGTFACRSGRISADAAFSSGFFDGRVFSAKFPLQQWVRQRQRWTTTTIL